MTAPTPDAVAQARREVLDARDNALRNISMEAVARLDAAWDAYDTLVGEAVRAECAADTRRLDWMQERYVAADFEYTIDEKPATALIIHAPRSARVGPNLRATIDAALEAHP